MILDVAFLPSGSVEHSRKICIVVDLLRASNTMIAMLEAGAESIELAASVGDAIRLSEGSRDTTLVCGESGGKPPAGFDLGNSPVEASERSLVGWRIVYATSNGTAAIRGVADARLVLVGALRNAEAVIGQALGACAEMRADLEIICAGDDGAISTSIEDVYAAGYLVHRIMERAGSWTVPDEAEPGDPRQLALDESALLALRLYQSYAGSGEDEGRGGAWPCFAEARNGRTLASGQNASDLDYCAEIDASLVVPGLTVRDERLLITRL